MRNKRSFLFVVVILMLVLSSVTPVAAKGGAPIYGADSATAIPGRYIVVFKPGTPAANVSAAAENARAAAVKWILSMNPR
jgi:aqualysin 1